MTQTHHAAAAAHARRHEAAQHGRRHAPHLRALGRRLQRLPRPLAGRAHPGGRARLPAAPGRPRPQGQQHLPDHERFALPLRRHPRPARAGGPHPAAAQGRPAARHPLPRGGRPPAGRRRRPLDAGAPDHGLRRRPARLRGGRARGHRHRQRPDDHPRPRGQGGARPLRHALAAAARDPARPLAPHPLAPLAVPGTGPVPADHGADGAARLPRGGRGRRARQVGDRPHPAPLLRHPPARARGRHPGDPGPAWGTGTSPRPRATPGSPSAPSARCRARSSCSISGRQRRPEPAW